MLIEKGVTMEHAWNLHPATALEMLGIAPNHKSQKTQTKNKAEKKTNSTTVIADTTASTHNQSDGRKLVAKYRKSTRNQIR